MKVINVKKIKERVGHQVLDACIENGYVKNAHGSLPDVDVDFDSERRQDVKEYLERRYNHNGKLRVFSAGTFTTEKIRSVIKDVCSVHKVSRATANYITAIIDEKADWTDLMMFAFENKKVRDFIEKNWEVFEEIRPLMLQPRAAGIHPSALIIIPDVVKGEEVECFDLLPIRKQNGMLVSEIDGYSIDDIGLLKNDVLSIAELTRFADMISACNENYEADISIPKILNTDLNDPKIYEIIQKGLTQGLFQISGVGMTNFMKQMNPTCVKDLIASIALFRPGTLNSGAAQGYCDAKNMNIEPEYLWGTYDALKDTYGYIVYQEQVSKIARSVGNLSLGDGVKLVKALSKKKIEKVRVFKDKYFEGAAANGCPKEVAEKIWQNVEDASKYLFNLSHATAYGLTAFVGTWIKLHYPVVFYAVMMKWVDKDKMPILLNEMREIEGVSITTPDINISTGKFVTDYEVNKIYWSLSRVKQCGVNATKYIIKDREVYGKYSSFRNFLERIFKFRLGKKEFIAEGEGKERCPITSLTVKNLIIAGAFDEIENVQSPVQRYGILEQYNEVMQADISSGIDTEKKDKAYYWAQLQIDISEFGFVDYEEIFKEAEKPKYVSRYEYMRFSQLSKLAIGEKKTIVVCARVGDVSEKKYKDSRDGGQKKFGKVELQQNTDVTEVTLWSDAWEENKHLMKVGNIIIAVAMTKYSEYENKNVLQINKGAFVVNV